MTTVGAAWALNPVTESVPSKKQIKPNVKEMIFEGEPQVVAQVMGSVVGAEATPTRQLRTLSVHGASTKRVVVTPNGNYEEKPEPPTAQMCAVVENLEEQFAENGRYPAVPTGEIPLEDFAYRTNGRRFQLEKGNLSYDSYTGWNEAESSEKMADSFRVSGFLETEEKGWGPWAYTAQKFSSPEPKAHSELGWLSKADVTPAWSARFYFPVDETTCGYLFRRTDGKHAYDHGQFTYDGVTGTFQLKLFRNKPAVSNGQFQAHRLESELSRRGEGCELVGEAGLLQDLGFLSASKKGEDSLVHLSTSLPIEIGADTSMQGLALSSFNRHKRVVEEAEFRVPTGSEADKATVVGSVQVVDKLGQIHQVRLRGGRGTQYDWVVGQLCPLATETVKVHESQAYEGAARVSQESTVIAGK